MAPLPVPPGQPPRPVPVPPPPAARRRETARQWPRMGWPPPADTRSVAILSRILSILVLNQRDDPQKVTPHPVFRVTIRKGRVERRHKAHLAVAARGQEREAWGGLQPHGCLLRPFWPLGQRGGRRGRRQGLWQGLCEARRGGQRRGRDGRVVRERTGPRGVRGVRGAPGVADPSAATRSRCGGEARRRGRILRGRRERAS